MSDIEEMKQGKNLKIIEINGSCSEPTHIYDPSKSSYFKAVKGILSHWKIVREIGETNRKMGVNYMKAMEIIKAFLDLNAYFKLIRKSVAAKEVEMELGS